MESATTFRTFCARFNTAVRMHPGRARFLKRAQLDFDIMSAIQTIVCADPSLCLNYQAQSIETSALTDEVGNNQNVAGSGRVAPHHFVGNRESIC